MAQDDPFAVTATTYNISMSCDTPDAEIRYESSGSADTVPADPTESSTLYTASFGLAVSDVGVQIKARGFKSGMEPSDVVTKIIRPVTVPMALPDGSVLFYDRGATYGEYSIGEDGYPVRLSSGEDDGSAESAYWRYLICDKSDLEGTRAWGPYGTSEGITAQGIGAGLENTAHMTGKYGSDNTYFWYDIIVKDMESGLMWFMPSKNELNLIYQNKDVITSNGGVALQSSVYWSSSENSGGSAWYQTFVNGIQNTDTKNRSNHCRLLRRI